MNKLINKLYQYNYKYVEEFMLQDTIGYEMYLFRNLLNSYLNNLHLTPVNKFFANHEFFVNKSYYAIIRQLSALTKINYNKESDSIEEFIINVYFYLSFKIKEQNLNKKSIEKIVKIKEIEPNNYKEKYFIPLRKIIKILEVDYTEKRIKDFYVLNSIATLDYVKGFSDLDLFAVVNEKVFSSKMTLNSFRKYLMKVRRQIYIFDHFQHHGVFFATELDINNYCEAFMPVVVLSKSKSLYDIGKNISHNLNIKIKDGCFYEKRLSIINNLILLSNMANRGISFFYDLAELKNLISQITIFSPLYIQLFDEYSYKKDAIKNISKYIGDIKVLNYAEKVRKEFPFIRIFNWFPLWIEPSLINKITRKIYKKNFLEKEELDILLYETKRFLFAIVKDLEDEKILFL